MRLILVLPILLIGCLSANKEQTEYQKRIAKLEADAKSRKERELAQEKSCQDKIVECESVEAKKENKQVILKCVEDLSGCTQTYSTYPYSQSKEFKSNMARINSVKEKCYEYGYQKKAGKIPGNGQHYPFNFGRIPGEFKTLKECVMASRANDGAVSNGCNRWDWCNEQATQVTYQED